MSPSSLEIPPTKPIEDRESLKALVRGAYDFQALRIQMGNRICAQFKARLGQPPSTTEEDSLDEESKTILDDLRVEYKKLTDGVKNFPRKAAFKATPLISTYTELTLIAQYIEFEASEEKHFRRMGAALEDFRIYTEFLEQIRGIGPAMAGVIMTEIDIHKANYPSSLWKFSGLDVAPDGAGRSRREEHLVEREYTSKDGKVKTRNSITYNPFLKTKLMGVLASSFLRCGKSPYAEQYANYKNRLENHPKWGKANEAVLIAAAKERGHKYAPVGHRHTMAMRYMIKRFLVDLYAAWRKIEGLPVAPEYSEGKLGMKHRANYAKQIEKKE